MLTIERTGLSSLFITHVLFRSFKVVAMAQPQKTTPTGFPTEVEVERKGSTLEYGGDYAQDSGNQCRRVAVMTATTLVAAGNRPSTTQDSKEGVTQHCLCHPLCLIEFRIFQNIFRFFFH